MDPLGLFIQPACLQHRYIRHSNSSHIFERPERLRAVLLGIAAAVARLEEAEATLLSVTSTSPANNANDDLSSLLSSLSIRPSFVSSVHLSIVQPPIPPRLPGQILQHHPALQLAHSSPGDDGLHQASLTASSSYLRDLVKWCNEAMDRIKETGSEIPQGLGLNQGDLYLGPGTILAIEGAIQTVCQAIDRVCTALPPGKLDPTTPPTERNSTPPGQTGQYFYGQQVSSKPFNKAFCAIRPPGHHCGEAEPSGFCYVNNVVVGALHAYLEHDIDRAIIIDFDLHHGNGTQALVMPLNAASYAEEIAVKAGKPSPAVYGKKGKRRRNWKSFYGSVHDIYSYPCEDGDIDLVKDASISLAAHGQYIENIHLQPYSSEEDFYERIYPKYIALLEKARLFIEDTQAEPDRTIVLISAGFDACEHEHQAMQRHDRRVPVSFFSRYTRDIVAFAEQYTEGKIVSVLEGGYSDRALTSAAMGHVIGLLNKPGSAAWWTENELINIEKATKKKRTGKIAPLPVELSGYTHLARTHALLAHFEGTSAPESIAPSAANTPQQGSRMTLRDRKKVSGLLGEEDVAVTPPPTRRVGRVKTGQTPKTTPVKLKVEDVPVPVPSITSNTAARTPALRLDDQDLVDSMTALGHGSLGKASETSSAAQARSTTVHSPVLSSDQSAVQSTVRADPPANEMAPVVKQTISNSYAANATPGPAAPSDPSKVFLRFSRPSPPITPTPTGPSAFTTSLYPPIPGLPTINGATEYRDIVARENSAGPSTESESEYASARSNISDEHDKRSG